MATKNDEKNVMKSSAEPPAHCQMMKLNQKLKQQLHEMQSSAAEALGYGGHDPENFLTQHSYYIQ